MNHSNYASKSYASVVLRDCLSSGKRGYIFSPIFLLCVVYTQSCIYDQRSMLLNFLIFYTSGDISSKSATFLLVIFFSTASSSSSVNSSSLMSSWSPIIFFNRFIIDFWRISKQILEIFFHFWSLFLGWQF